MLMPGERFDGEGENMEAPPAQGLLTRTLIRFNRARDRGFDRLRNACLSVLKIAPRHWIFSLVFIAVLGVISGWMVFGVGTDFFPALDAGLMKLHFRAPAGTRIEETKRMSAAVEDTIRQVIPAEEIDTINDMLGVPIFYNLAFVQTENVGGMDADILISLKKGHHPTEIYRRRLREALPKAFPGSTFYFRAADIVTQVLNFGITSQLSVQVEATDLDLAYQYARKVADSIRTVPGTADVHINEVLNYPTFQVDVDRSRLLSWA
jgi:multidrug efflux pump subunit AcrB